MWRKSPEIRLASSTLILETYVDIYCSASGYLFLLYRRHIATDTYMFLCVVCLIKVIHEHFCEDYGNVTYFHYYFFQLLFNWQMFQLNQISREDLQTGTFSECWRRILYGPDEFPVVI